jgi:hypothetical protein
MGTRSGRTRFSRELLPSATLLRPHELPLHLDSLAERPRESTKPCIDSFGVLTSRMTVLIVPPRYLLLKIREQLIWRREPIKPLRGSNVHVVSLACFVIEANSACSIDHIRPSVLVWVPGSWCFDLVGKLICSGWVNARSQSEATRRCRVLARCRKAIHVCQAHSDQPLDGRPLRETLSKPHRLDLVHELVIDRYGGSHAWHLAH